MKINYILTLILVFCIGASIPVLIGSSQVNEQHSAKSEVPYCVTSPTVPAQVTFDGETIDLRRYDRRERMDREMMAFTYMHSTTMLLIKRANRYFPIIEPILKANGIPDDFKYLMVIESNLNSIARSPAGAAGLWQFMPTTGREFGLEVNENVDERYHIEKSYRSCLQIFQTGICQIWRLDGCFRRLQCRTGTYLLPTRQTTGKPCHGLVAGRRNFPLHVPHIGSQRDIQQPATLRVSVESGNICIRPFLQKGDRLY